MQETGMQFHRNRECVVKVELLYPKRLPYSTDGEGRERLVAHGDYEQGLRKRSGFYQAACERRIAVGRTTAPPRFPCHPCGEQEPRA